MIVAIIYLVGVIISFAYLTWCLDEPYELAVVTSVFYPVLLIVGFLLVIVTFIAALILYLVETVKYAVRSIKK